MKKGKVGTVDEQKQNSKVSLKVLGWDGGGGRGCGSAVVRVGKEEEEEGGGEGDCCDRREEEEMVDEEGKE